MEFLPRPIIEAFGDFNPDRFSHHLVKDCPKAVLLSTEGAECMVQIIPYRESRGGAGANYVVIFEADNLGETGTWAFVVHDCPNADEALAHAWARLSALLE